jgi:hypothetical protein
MVAGVVAVDSGAEVVVMASADPPEWLAAAALVPGPAGRTDFQVEGSRMREVTAASMAAVFAGEGVTFGGLTGTFLISASTALAIPVTLMTTSNRTITPTPTLTGIDA